MEIFKKNLKILPEQPPPSDDFANYDIDGVSFDCEVGVIVASDNTDSEIKNEHTLKRVRSRDL
jgi:hypothetical protein